MTPTMATTVAPDGSPTSASDDRPDRAATAAWRALGTTARVVVTEPQALPEARRLLCAELTALDEACSRFRDDSELVRVSASSRGRLVPVSPLLAEAVGVALRAAELTDGAVDPTVGDAMDAIGYDRDWALMESTSTPVRIRALPAPGWRRVVLDADGCRLSVPDGVRLDLGATAKALSSDRAARDIAAVVGGGVLVSLGGDIAVAGVGPRSGWRVRVQDITDAERARPDGPFDVITIRSGAVATSSTTARRWIRGGIPLHHILDPRIGLPVESPWRTVSVAAGTCVDANTAATAAIVRGAAALPWLESLRLPARFVRTTGAVTTIAGWPADPTRES